MPYTEPSHLYREVPAMSIAFEPEEVMLQKLRECLRKMSDEEQIEFGKERYLFTVCLAVQ